MFKNIRFKEIGGLYIFLPRYKKKFIFTPSLAVKNVLKHLLEVKKKERRLTRGGNTWYEYRKFKKRILEERKYKCEDCPKKAETIHHKKSPVDYPELELVSNNVLAVCMDCHVKHHPEIPEGFIRNGWH